MAAAIVREHALAAEVGTSHDHNLLALRALVCTAGISQIGLFITIQPALFS